MDGSAQRFSFKAHGEVEFYLACDFKQARIWLWPGVFGMRGTYKTLAYSSNVDERDVRRRWLVARDENSDCFGIDLTAAEVEHMRAILTAEALEATRTIDESYMARKSNYMCYRDGWSLDFSAESDGGRPIVEIKDISWCSYKGEEEAFETLFDWIGDHYEIWDLMSPGRGNWNKKMSDSKIRRSVSDALDRGLDGVEDILFGGKSAQIRLLGELPHEHPFTYEIDYPTGCCIRYGRYLVRMHGLSERPNCMRVFGESHDFDAPTE